MFSPFKRSILLVLLTFSQLSNSKIIIWDLGNTLFKTSKFGVAYNVGFWYFIAYTLFDLQSPNIQPIIYDILERIDPSKDYSPERATDLEGRPLPLIMHKWLAGSITSKELRKSLKCYIKLLDSQRYFISYRQRDLVARALEVMFTPEILARNTYPLMQGIQLLQECYWALNRDGIPKNKLMILSNWDLETSRLIRLRFPKIFNYFDSNHIIISAALGLVKPNKAIFEYILKAYALNPADCLFIDDQCVNILAAKSCGITGLLLCNQNYEAVRNELIKLNAL